MPLDIALGILVSIFIGNFYFAEAPAWFIFLGVIFALLPDIDILLYFFNKKVRKNWSYIHRSYVGYPLVYIPLSVFVYLIFGESIGLLFFILTFLHNLHDTFFIGWGVMWFWPFSKRKYKFFPDRNGVITTIPVISWLPNEEEKVRNWSNGTNKQQENWVKHYYFRFNILSITEWGMFLISLFILSYCLFS